MKAHLLVFYPQMPITHNLLAFNRRTSQLLGILPRLPVTLGGKTVHMDVMVVPGPLDFNLLLGHDYTYAMGALVSSLFRVVCFPHEGWIVTIDQLSFFGPDMATGPPSSLPSFYPPVVSAPPQVNYVATYPVPVLSDSAVVHQVLGALGLDFQDVFLPSGVELLEAMTSCSL